MKKVINVFLVLTLVFSILTGCGNSATKSSSQLKGFSEENGLLVYTDKINSPFENSGLSISIKQGTDGYAKFIKTDKEGKETVDYYNFSYEKNQVEKYYYVSAMGTGFYYHYDLASNTLLKVEDIDHKDTTKSVKDSGRWDNAVLKVDDEIKSLEKYFMDQYKMSIKDSVVK
ncbi:hypothetical protein LGK97_06490 [Clostridium sp. CS001]|uniref:hypothetical protein n=1 Tax=Clostridium sp. CS001 TaxID=2880648 RepID=UPI001CF4F45A|nr:hypothetical protein [Clostridium sp. CS001]MCB2289413.1 hypothetical protein [Clostridium sp. CS001]